MGRLINILYLLLQAVTYIINKYSEKKMEKQYEEIRSDTASQWVSGFGMRAETKTDPTKTDTEHK